MQDPREFAISVIRTSHEWGKKSVEGIMTQVKEPIRGQALIDWCHHRMWGEYKLGCEPPARIISLLPDDAQDLKILYSKQIYDEWNHAMVFAKRAKELGGHGDLTRFAPPAQIQAIYNDFMRWDDFLGIATVLNCTSEVKLQLLLKRWVGDHTSEPLVDKETAQAVQTHVLVDDEREWEGLIDRETASRMQEVIADEGPHIRTGRLLLERYATTPELQEYVLSVQRHVMDGDLSARI